MRTSNKILEQSNLLKKQELKSLCLSIWCRNKTSKNPDSPRSSIVRT